jgi:hypothetical protein
MTRNTLPDTKGVTRKPENGSGGVRHCLLGFRAVTATWLALATILVCLLASCGTSGAVPSAAVRTPQPTMPTTCHARGTDPNVLPDPRCTPGAINPAVTEANLATTICKRGWATSVRPPTSYTTPLKRRLMSAYGDTGALSGSELDHLVPLELGGAPSDVRNLWPEPGASPNPKDAIENYLNHAVCSHKITLPVAQSAIALDWTKAEQVVEDR